MRFGDTFHLSLPKDTLRVFARIGEVARGLAEGILESHQEVGHGQARDIVVKAEAAVLQVGVVDVRLIEFEIVTKRDIVLSLVPAEHVTEICGIPDELGIGKVADGEVAGDRESCGCRSPPRVIGRCLNRRSSYPALGHRGRLADRDPRPNE